MWIEDIYEGTIFRPPSEAHSLILQATIGCSWGKCTFCVAFREKEFRIKSMAQLEADVEKVLPYYLHATRIFLADGNALCIPTDQLESEIKMLYKRFPDLELVTLYGGPLDIKKKTPEELTRLKEAGLSMIYIGLESGSAEVLKLIKKGATPKDMVSAAKKLRDVGIPLSVIFILGLGGKELSSTHAKGTAKVLSAMDPPYAAALTLMVEPGAPILEDVTQKRIDIQTPQEDLTELRAIVSGLEVTNMVFRANHPSNYVIFKATLPNDKQRLLEEIDGALAQGKFRPESFRRL
jgi:radical SAM superfamily enzyme YgiQ (UPF0313 family)